MGPRLNVLTLTQEHFLNLLWLCYVAGFEDGHVGYPMMEHDEFTEKQLAAIAQMEAPEIKERH